MNVANREITLIAQLWITSRWPVSAIRWRPYVALCQDYGARGCKVGLMNVSQKYVIY